MIGCGDKWSGGVCSTKKPFPRCPASPGDHSCIFCTCHARGSILSASFESIYSDGYARRWSILRTQRLFGRDNRFSWIQSILQHFAIKFLEAALVSDPTRLLCDARLLCHKILTTAFNRGTWKPSFVPNISANLSQPPFAFCPFLVALRRRTLLLISSSLSQFTGDLFQEYRKTYRVDFDSPFLRNDHPTIYALRSRISRPQKLDLENWRNHYGRSNRVAIIKLSQFFFAFDEKNWTLCNWNFERHFDCDLPFLTRSIPSTSISTLRNPVLNRLCPVLFRPLHLIL